MHNQAISQRLREIAAILEMKGVDFKPRAYRKAARRVESLGEDVEAVHERGDLTDIEGVGDSIASKIAEFLETGEMSYYRELKSEYSVDVMALTTVEGIGPERAAEFYEELGVEDLTDLQEAAENGAIADLEGFGEQLQANIDDHIELAERSQERTPIGRAFDRATEIHEHLAAEAAFDRVRLVGSFRRRRPTIGDVDVLATAPDPESAMDAFSEQEAVEEVLARGGTKSSVLLPGGLQVDLRIVDDTEFGAATVYLTGSVDHNVALRERAQDRGWKLNEYGLFDISDTADDGQHAGDRLAGKDETGVYDALGLVCPPPELRENTGELDAAADEELPDLVELDDIRGDLQLHTTVSDGANSLREMAERAAELDREYMLVTDHGPTLDVTEGLDDDAFDEQRETVADVNDDVDVEVLHGVEADITEDGLGVPDRWCDAVDLLVVAMHDPPEDPTERLVSVLQNYPADIVAHPLNRQINDREPMDLDLPRVAEVASDEDVALEINAQPERLDLDWYNVKQHRDDVSYVVSTDAHDTSELGALHLGVSQARRGWCETENILNTRPLDDLMAAFGR
jgi:DNA polymerase (family 10)